jgi:hypothetical protein
MILTIGDTVRRIKGDHGGMTIGDVDKIDNKNHNDVFV